ncbi:MAG: PHP domain-containing protein [Firmicutes bacterium]|nr:PHP domain-containing protein [Bacillota bacterium]
MIDLHTHSTASDGRDAPDELVEKAVEQGLTALSLTDHDSVNGLAEAAQAAHTAFLTFIPGIEITTDFEDNELHLLGYFIDYQDPEIIQVCIDIHQARRQRAKEILDRLAKEGFPLSWEEVNKDSDGFVGRSHIVDALVDKGLVSPVGRDHFFDVYLSKAGRAYVPHYYISPDKAIRLIWKSGGVPVLAHPGRMNGDWDLKKLVDMGIAGIEAWYPTHTRQETAFYLEQAQCYGLVPTGGSDYHGRGKQVLGMPEVPDETIELLREAAVKGGGK